jgi:hypothetical protein
MFEICSVALTLLVWFNTDAFIEYAELLRFTKFFYIKEYLRLREDDPSLTYRDFLQEYHNCFFVRLITCPICTSVWAGIFIGQSPIPIIFGLLVYLIIVKLL